MFSWSGHVKDTPLPVFIHSFIHSSFLLSAYYVIDTTPETWKLVKKGQIPALLELIGQN